MLGIPRAMDVLSNIPFLIAGIWGLARLPHGRPTLEHRLTALFFAGLLVTAAGSTWYHWQPDDARLVVDRCGMVIAFAGIVGLALANRISDRLAVASLPAVLLLGPLTAWTAWKTGNHLPWGVLQFGGMALLMFSACLPAGNGLRIRWVAVLVLYALAKVFELGDPAFFSLGHAVSGHTLKHLFSALAAWPVIAALGPAHDPMQNGRATTKGPTLGTGHA
jgi:hypothetical protein